MDKIPPNLSKLDASKYDAQNPIHVTRYNIRRLRLERYWAQTYLATQLNLGSGPSVSMLERPLDEAVSEHILERLMTIFKVDQSEFQKPIPFVPKPPPKEEARELELIEILDSAGWKYHTLRPFDNCVLFVFPKHVFNKEIHPLIKELIPSPMSKNPCVVAGQLRYFCNVPRCSNGVFIIIIDETLNAYQQTKTMVHEVVHVVNRVCDWIGVQLDLKYDEFQAYFTGDIYDSMVSLLKQNQEHFDEIQKGMNKTSK